MRQHTLRNCCCTSKQATPSERRIARCVPPPILPTNPTIYHLLPKPIQVSMRRFRVHVHEILLIQGRGNHTNVTYTATRLHCNVLCFSFSRVEPSSPPLYLSLIVIGVPITISLYASRYLSYTLVNPLFLLRSFSATLKFSGFSLDNRRLNGVIFLHGSMEKSGDEKWKQ